MKKVLYFMLSVAILSFVTSCKKEEDEDEGKLPNISFKTGAAYISKDTALAAGENFMIGIDASKSESADVLKKFNVSVSVNGAASTTLVDSTLTGTQGDVFAYDFMDMAGSASGETSKYTFTVTNRDGLVNKVSLTVTVQ